MRIIFTFAVFCALVAGGDAVACSPPAIGASAYDHFSENAKVFVGTVERGPVSGDSVYDVRVDEAFKGFPEGNKKYEGSVPVTFNFGQCGFDKPNAGDRFLVYMNDGKPISSVNGTVRLWPREKQDTDIDYILAPNLDNVILLRQLLNYHGQLPTGVAADEESAIHIAVKAMIPVYGKDMVAKYLPYKAVYQADKKTAEERVWHVSGTLHCADHASGCLGGTPEADVNRWSGEVTRLFASK